MTCLCGKTLKFEFSLGFREKILNLRISHGLEAIYTDSNFCVFFFLRAPWLVLVVKAVLCCELLLSRVLMHFSCSRVILHPEDALGRAMGKKLDEDGQNRRCFPKLGWLCSSQSMQKTSSARRNTSNTTSVCCSWWLKPLQSSGSVLCWSSGH